MPQSKVAPDVGDETAAITAAAESTGAAGTPRESTSGRSSPSKISQLDFDSKLAQSVLKRKRKWRSFVHLMIVGIFIGVWCSWIVPQMHIVEDYPYDASASTVVLTTTACDIEFVDTTSAAATMRFSGRRSAVEYEQLDDGKHSFTNPLGCNEMPRRECRRMCLISVQVPSAASGVDFVVEQNDEDETTFGNR